MKSILYFLLAILLIYSCKPKNNIGESGDKLHLHDSDMEDHDLLGEITESDLSKEPYSDWYNPSDYNPNYSVIQELKPLLQDVSFDVFFGSWCSDSQEHVPHLMQILKEADYDFDNISLIAVGDEDSEYYKKTKEGLEEGRNIDYVPTIIIMKNSVELGRIVESPVKSLEEDLLTILSGEDYKHTYAE